MLHLMSREGPEVLIGEATHTLIEGYPCTVVGLDQQSGLVRLRFADGEEGDYAPAVINCYLLPQDHPQD